MLLPSRRHRAPPPNNAKLYNRPLLRHNSHRTLPLRKHVRPPLPSPLPNPLHSNPPKKSFHANRALLTQTSLKTSGTTGRPLHSSPGTLIPAPSISLTGITLVSLLLLLQLLGLAYLAYYIYKVPTWTPHLDALSIARITSSLDRGIVPGLGAVYASDIQRLDAADATIGIVEGAYAFDPSSDSAQPLTQVKTVELGLGASGVFTSRLARFRVRRAQAASDMQCRCEGCRSRGRRGSVSSTSSHR